MLGYLKLLAGALLMTPLLIAALFMAVILTVVKTIQFRGDFDR